MKDVQAHELSALLDGELDIKRAEEVRARIESDPALRAEYESLASLDARLCHAAANAAFEPNVALPVDAMSKASSGQWLAGFAVAMALVAVRFMPKLIDLQMLGFGIQLAAVAAIAVIVIRLGNETASWAHMTVRT